MQVAYCFSWSNPFGQVVLTFIYIDPESRFDVFVLDYILESNLSPSDIFRWTCFHHSRKSGE